MKTRNLFIRASWSALVLALLAGCGGADTQVTETPLPPPSETTEKTYSGPAASTDDVQFFKQALWDNIATESRCGGCHIQEQQSPSFARDDDINKAYTETGGLVDLSRPSDSVLVTKVAGGHNCWLTSDTACADIMTTWINNWATLANAQNASTEIQLEAPVARRPGNTKNFPASSTDFANTVYPLLNNFCVSCHTGNATIPIAPYFASSDIDEAYAAAKDRINLDTPQDSRFVVRLRDQFHNCWSGDCSADGQALADAISAFSDNIDVTEIDPELVYSDALSLFDGVLASGGGRYDTNVIGKWEFKAGSGNTAFDTSGVDPALDLTLSGDYQWVGGYGIQFNDGKAQGSTTNSQKLHDLLVGSGEFALEAWIAPANVTQEGPARIISYSGGNDRRNVTLGQTLYNYNVLLRHEHTDSNGDPMLSTDDDAEVLQASLQHVVVNYSPTEGRRIFVNGLDTGVLDSTEAGSLQDWDESFAFVLGSEVSGEHPFAGVIRMVAIHSRTLSEEEISANFAAGVGQKYFLLFGLSHLIDIPQSYLLFEVSQYDSYSYLFIEPRLISLDPEANISDVDIRGIRIGINGRESAAGQVFATLETTVTAADYQPATGLLLSRQGTIIPLEKGPALDEFFVTFEQLGEQTHVVVPQVPAAPAEPADLAPQSDIGVRQFAQINATMAALTQVDASSPSVQTTYLQLQQQLPSVTDLTSFVAANQMAITQLAIRYCDTLVEDDALRTAYFTDFDFDLAPNLAFAGSNRDGIITPLLDNMLKTGLNLQADRNEVATELSSLIDRLSQCNGTSNCDASYTRTITKASCAAVLGSATTLIQ